MADLYSTDVLMGVVQDLKTPTSWLLDRYFGAMFTDPSEEIHFDLIPGKRRIAPFVSPLVEGKLVDSKGFETKTFKPAYIKDKRIFDSSRPFKRAIGEKIGGSMSPQERLNAQLALDLEDQVAMITRRLEVMASEGLRTGKITVKGEKYPAVTVDFQRAVGHTLAALTGTARWGQSAGVPLENLAAWGATVLQATGVFPNDVVLGTTAWNKFRVDATVKDRLLAINSSGTALSQAAPAVEGGQYMGTIDGFNIFAYGGWYVDPDTGTETAIFPAEAVLMTSPLVEGVRAFGAIRDEVAGFQAVPYFPKSWVDQDPAVRWLMMQSAPLVVPTRVDATIYNPNVTT